MPSQPVKLASDGGGKWIDVLTIEGDVYRVDLPDGALKKIIDHASYCAAKDTQCIGMALDRDRRLYVVENAFDYDARPQMNHVTIHRSAPNDVAMKPWFQIDIPFAIDVFQHGVSHIAQGPDGFIYVSSGSRTDHGEKGNDPKRSTEGETPVTSCIWRLDPKQDQPKLEIFAKGIRNAFGFCFDDRGRLFASENGPNADAPEELNFIEKGKHYGFPYRFADWDHKAYDDQPEMPAGLKTEPPVAMFDPHSSPSGVVCLGDDFPPPYRGTLLVARFGNLIGPKEVGFDIVQVKLKEDKKGSDPFMTADKKGSLPVLTGEVAPFMSPVARPTDLHLDGHGKIYVCEIWRQIHNAGEQQPGRILEIAVDR
jgi:glucose/arabinose dehydrogenase